MFEAGPSEREPLGEGLMLRAVETSEDIERLAAFNGRIHGEEVAALTLRLLRDHPHTRARHWLLVEESASGRIVSSLCLIPWQLRLDHIDLRAGEMGIVGTDEAFRRRGLVRAQVARFDRLLRDEAFELTHIQGIPYFYRQFGYHHAVPLIPDLRMAPDRLPDEPAPAGLRFRAAKLTDIPALATLYGDLTRSAAAAAGLASVRDEATWRYLLEGPTAGEGETWCLEREASGVIGYFRTHRRGFGQGLIVSEASPLAWRDGFALLAELKRRVIGAGKPYLKLEMDPDCELAGLARSLGAQTGRTYAWQIRFVDPASLLRKLAPLLERRLEDGLFRGLTERLVIDLYREAYELEWERGRLVRVESVRAVPAGRAPVRLPPEALVPLVLGHRSLSELASWNHDVNVEPRAAALLEVLFPRLHSYLYGVY